MRDTAKGQNNKTLGIWQQCLERKLDDLHSMLEEENNHPLPDFIMIETLKRHRAKVRAELAAIEGVLRTIGEPAPSKAA